MQQSAVGGQSPRVSTASGLSKSADGTEEGEAADKTEQSGLSHPEGPGEAREMS